jgi:hypothetical protein
MFKHKTYVVGRREGGGDAPASHGLNTSWNRFSAKRAI